MDKANVRNLQQAVKNMDISNIQVKEKLIDHKSRNECTSDCPTTSTSTATMTIDESSDTAVSGAAEQMDTSVDSTEQSTTHIKWNPSASTSSTSSDVAENVNTGTKVIFMLGMAGVGKTSFTQRLAAHLLAQKKTPYIINLDPACEDPPFPVNIDIRDSVDYIKVMKQYNLGPNGGIVTSLNLFTTILDQVIDLVKLRAKTHKYILVDAPGQLECFLWSASGDIILSTFAAYFPTIITYIIDLTKCVNPITFASNMMYGVTILFKSKLPMIIALNKMDVNPGFGEKVQKWITDFEEVETYLRDKDSYSANLASSLTLALEEFYSVVHSCTVSAADGYGLNQYQGLVGKCVEEYITTYLELFKEMKKDYEKKLESKKASNLERFRKDFHSGKRDELFSLQATNTLSEGIDLIPHDDDDDLTSDSDSAADSDDEGDTIQDFRNKEASRRDNKYNLESELSKSVTGMASTSRQPPQL